MRLLPQSIVWRVLLALLGAAVAVVALDLAIRRQDAKAAVVTTERPGGPPVPPPPGCPVAVVGGEILLACRASSIEPAVAPVVQVLADGSVALRRPAPLATGPTGDATTAVRRAAIVLPGPSFSQLDPAARGALVGLFGQLVDVRPVPASRFRAVDFALASGELEALLAWVP